MQTFIDALPLAPEESQRLTSPKALRLEPNLRHLAVCRIKPKNGTDKSEIKIMQLYPAQASRRDLLQGVACAAAAGTTFAVSKGAAFARGKRSKADVEYQDTPHGIERCEICAPFLPPDECRTVVGPVSRQGWCKIYEGA